MEILQSNTGFTGDVILTVELILECFVTDFFSSFKTALSLCNYIHYFKKFEYHHYLYLQLKINKITLYIRFLFYYVHLFWSINSTLI